MNQAHDILRRLFEAMEPPRSNKASAVWDEAREFLRRPEPTGPFRTVGEYREALAAGPDLADATGLAFRSAEEQRHIEKTRRLAASYHFGWPKPSRWTRSPPQRMVAADLDENCPGLRRMEEEDNRRRAIAWYQMQAAMFDPTTFAKEYPAVFGLDLGRDPDAYRKAMTETPARPIAECNCEGEGFGGGRHTKHCPKYVNPDRYHKD